ncbi:hypothetical protein BJ878DRAFT_86420 [Calycina marina]|uniref:Uncharacterized protein n=1 Tax=Calycina marina TaxID=1763456 RepID=A0A9P7Z2I2_9HELO|nr:hypothetical protein BJ878DRAFT_86420 [Calycina marina]
MTTWPLRKKMGLETSGWCGQGSNDIKHKPRKVRRCECLPHLHISERTATAQIHPQLIPVSDICKPSKTAKPYPVKSDYAMIPLKKRKHDYVPKNFKAPRNSGISDTRQPKQAGHQSPLNNVKQSGLPNNSSVTKPASISTRVMSHGITPDSSKSENVAQHHDNGCSSTYEQFSSAVSASIDLKHAIPPRPSEKPAAATIGDHDAQDAQDDMSMISERIMDGYLDMRPHNHLDDHVFRQVTNRNEIDVKWGSSTLIKSAAASPSQVALEGLMVSNGEEAVITERQ